MYENAGKCLAGTYWTYDKKYKYAGDLTVYAQWTLTSPKYTLTRNPNGGTQNGKTTATIFANGLAIGSTAYWDIGVPTRSGYTFAGWFTAADGGEKVYDSAGKCVAGTYWGADSRYRHAGDLTVYARWVAAGTKYTLTRDPNGGAQNGKTTAAVFADGLAVGSTAYWDIGVPTRSGYAFVGWFTAASGGEKVYDNAGKCLTGVYWGSDKRYRYAGNLTVYARWVAAGTKFTLTRDPNGGSQNGMTTATIFANGLAVGSTAYWDIGVPTRSGYAFNGWFTAVSGGEKVYDNAGKCIAGTYWNSSRQYSYDGALTVYAQWTKLSSLIVAENCGKRRLMEEPEPLPGWAVGTFDGAVLGETADGELGMAGVVTLTVAADGGISGKMLEGGRTWTLSAPALKKAGDSPAAYRALVTGRSGELAFTGEVSLAADGSVERGIISGAFSSPLTFSSWQNVWKAGAWKAAAEPFAEAPVLVTPDGVSLRFSASGAVTATYGAHSCSSVLIPVTLQDNYQLPTINYQLFLYFPPKEGEFGGYAAEIPLIWDGAEFVLAE